MLEFQFSLVESLVDLQSLSSAMSMSAAVVANNNKKSAAWGADAAVTAKSGIDFHLDEEMYPYLDKKPGAERRAGGNAKGRRRAADALIMRKLYNQAYLVKSIVDVKSAATVGGFGGRIPAADLAADPAALLGKKRRVRLLTEHVQDFNIAVPYSLNRKNRWQAADENAAGCLAALAESAPVATRGDPRVKLSVVQSYFNLSQNGSGRVKAYHELDANGDVRLASESRSSRGAPLKDLMNVGSAAGEKAGEALASDAEDIHIQYHLARAHNSSRMMGAHMNTSNARSVKHRRICANTINLSGKRGNNDDDECFYAPPAVLSSAERSERVAAAAAVVAARTPPRRLFSLADFVVENATPPVIVRRAKTGRNRTVSEAAKDEIENQFVVATASELEDDLLGEKLDKEYNEATSVVAPLDIEKLTRQWIKRHDAKYSTFVCFEVLARHCGIFKQVDWVAQSERLLADKSQTVWTQNSHRLAVDLSTTLANRMYYESTGAPILIVVMEYHEKDDIIKVIINGAFASTLTRRALSSRFNNNRGKVVQFDTLLKEMIAICALSGIEFPPTAVEEPHQKRSFHSRDMIVTASATTNEEIVASNAAAAAASEQSRQALGATFEQIDDDAASIISDSGEESKTENEAYEENDDLDLDDFEHIDMDTEFGTMSSMVETAVTDTTVIEPTVVLQSKCRTCGTSTATKLICQPECGHVFCVACLYGTFVRGARFEERSLLCPEAKCTGHVSLSILQSIAPLALVAQFAVAHHLASLVNNNQFLAECPYCDAYLNAQSDGDYGQVCCSRCETVFCASCRLSAHWPLSCTHAVVWAEKFTAQTITREIVMRCSEARSRRADVNSGRQLARNLGRLVGGHTAVADFVEKRKMALHLIEYGVAWLYMNRSEAKTTIGQLKPLLSAVHKKIESLDSEILFSGSLTDVDHVVYKVADLSRAVDALVAKFKSVC